MSVVRFIADQGTFYRVPIRSDLSNPRGQRFLAVQVAAREPTERQCRRAALDKRVRELFERSTGTYGSPRVHADLIDESWLYDSHITDASLHTVMVAIATSLRTLSRLCRIEIGMFLAMVVRRPFAGPRRRT